MDELNPGLTSGDIETLEAALLANEEVFLAPESNAGSTLDQWKSEVVAFQAQIDNWNALMEADKATETDEATEEDLVAGFTARVAADELAIAAITDFQTWMTENIVDPWEAINTAADEAAAAGTDDTTVSDDSNDSNDSNDSDDSNTSQRNIVA